MFLLLVSRYPSEGFRYKKFIRSKTIYIANNMIESTSNMDEICIILTIPNIHAVVKIIKISERKEIVQTPKFCSHSLCMDERLFL